MRKGVSPVIATVLLTAVTISLAFIIFSSGKGFLTQLSPAPYCERVAFVAGIYNQDGVYFLEVENTGNEIIQGFDLLVADNSLGEIDVSFIRALIDAGKSMSEEINLDTDISGKELKLIPIILNEKGESKTCDLKFGKQITLSPA